ncbi:uncharacterized protein BROUX77_007994 [Berkeleyomyces rouxiae]|uniref:uncharacterized protein n=1 Tax=Berkeleyomyces rouxiae TaxID=2035830 RepID=UPI003B7C8DFE
MLTGFAKLDLPWAQWPLISNAPMSGVATSQLAVAVTQAGGLGQIGFTGDPALLDRELSSARRHLHPPPQPQSHDAEAPQQPLPVGAGIIVFGASPEAFMPVLAQHAPAVVWLSFGSAAELQHWTASIRQHTPQSKVWIQLGSVRAALEAARLCKPDALVLQGSDAGGHGHAGGSSIVPLLPEVADALRAAGLPALPLVAAGGIMDGRGAAAALALGAAGVVMGTRFLGAAEASVPVRFRKLVLEAVDGGESTARSRAFDAMWGTNVWPETYDGRCLKNAMYRHVSGGMSHAEARAKLYEAASGAAGRGLDAQDTMSVWAGAGVGLVNQVQTAADIVGEVRADVLQTVAALGDAMHGRAATSAP